MDATFAPRFPAYREALDVPEADLADAAFAGLDFFAAARCFLNFERTTGRLASVFAAFVVLVADLAVDLAAIAGSPEKLIQIPAAATSAANPAFLIRMAISPFARATSNDEKTGAEWPQDGRKRESCDLLP
ncbi:hypothetical protein [Afipia clevelandensis]|uniref:hypothetical protein n=1 Tax=Afipia clevelandensis TaxID=1034 RepID=UPI001FD94170|nr:hypothetical protein [Afipia clevelandensis]